MSWNPREKKTIYHLSDYLIISISSKKWTNWRQKTWFNSKVKFDDGLLKKWINLCKNKTACDLQTPAKQTHLPSLPPSFQSKMVARPYLSGLGDVCVGGAIMTPRKKLFMVKSNKHLNSTV